MIRSARLLTSILCAAYAAAIPAAPILAGDLSQLTDQQKADGVGQLQKESPPPAAAPSKQDNCKPSRNYRSGWYPGSGPCNTNNGLPVTTAVASVAAPFVLFQAIFDPKDGVSFWNLDDIPRIELSFNPTWTFESRTNQELVVGNPWAQSKRFDLTGAQGFATRVAIDPFAHLGFEAIFDYTSHNESLQFFNATDFATQPHISFIDSTVAAVRSSTIAGGQINALLREEPYNLLLLGLRWWHQDDFLSLQVLPGGAAWSNETQTNTPFLQLGGSGAVAGTRTIWINRFSAGIGANWTTVRTKTANVVGVANVADINEVRCAGFAELKSEFRYAITDRFSINTGAQFLALTNSYRSASQLRSTNLASGASSPNSDTILLSSLFTGVSYQY